MQTTPITASEISKIISDSCPTHEIDEIHDGSVIVTVRGLGSPHDAAKALAAAGYAVQKSNPWNARHSLYVSR